VPKDPCRCDLSPRSSTDAGSARWTGLDLQSLLKTEALKKRPGRRGSGEGLQRRLGHTKDKAVPRSRPNRGMA